MSLQLPFNFISMISEYFPRSHIKVIVAKNYETNKLIACCFYQIHKKANYGRILDITVDQNYDSKNLLSDMISMITELAYELNENLSGIAYYSKFISKKVYKKLRVKDFTPTGFSSKSLLTKRPYDSYNGIFFIKFLSNSEITFKTHKALEGFLQPLLSQYQVKTNISYQEPESNENSVSIFSESISFDLVFHHEPIKQYSKNNNEDEKDFLFKRYLFLEPNAFLYSDEIKYGVPLYIEPYNNYGLFLYSSNDKEFFKKLPILIYDLEKKGFRNIEVKTYAREIYQINAILSLGFFPSKFVPVTYSDGRDFYVISLTKLNPKRALKKLSLPKEIREVKKYLFK